jgi:hypothetical protein
LVTAHALARFIHTTDGNELLANRMQAFYTACGTHHRETMDGVKRFVLKFPLLLRWEEGANPGLHKIIAIHGGGSRAGRHGR